MIREFFICAIASALEPLVKLDRVSPDLYERIGFRAIDFILSQDLVPEAFRFDNINEAYEYFYNSLNDYLYANYNEFFTIFIKRAKHKNCFIRKWIYYATYLFIDNNSAMKMLRKTTKDKYNYEFIDDINYIKSI